MSRDTAERFGRKSDILQFQNWPFFTFFYCFFIISGPFHISTRPGGEVPGAQRSDRAAPKLSKIVKNHQKSVIFRQNQHFADFARILIILSWTSVSAPCAIFYFWIKNFLQVWKNMKFCQFLHIFHIFCCTKKYLLRYTNQKMVKMTKFWSFLVFFDDFFILKFFSWKILKKLHTFTVARRAYQILDGVNFDTLFGPLVQKGWKVVKKVVPEG